MQRGASQRFSMRPSSSTTPSGLPLSERPSPDDSTPLPFLGQRSSGDRLGSIDETEVSSPMVVPTSTVAYRISPGKRRRKQRSSVADIPQHLLADIGSIRDAVSHPGAVPKPGTSQDFSNDGQLKQPIKSFIQQFSYTQNLPSNDQPSSISIGETIMKENCLYCSPVTAVPGVLTLTPNAITFEPDPRSQFVRDLGIGQFQAFIDLNDIIACAAVMLPDGPLLSYYLGFCHESSGSWQEIPKISDGGGLTSILPAGQPSPISKGPTPSFFQIVVQRLNGNYVGKGRKLKRRISLKPKRQNLSLTMESASSIRHSPLRHTLEFPSPSEPLENSSRMELSSLMQEKHIFSPDSQKLTSDKQTFKRRRSTGELHNDNTIKHFEHTGTSDHSKSDLQQNNTLEIQKRINNRFNGHLIKSYSFPVISIIEKSNGSYSYPRSKIPSILHHRTIESLDHPYQSITNTPDRKSLNLQVDKTTQLNQSSRAYRLFASLSSWTKWRSSSRSSAVDRRLLTPRQENPITSDPLPDQPFPVTAIPSLGRSRVTPPRHDTVITDGDDSSFLRDRRHDVGRYSTLLKFPRVSIDDGDDTGDDEASEPPQDPDSVLFRFSDHSVVRELTRRTMLFIDRRDYLRRQTLLTDLSQVQDSSESSQRRSSSFDQPSFQSYKKWIPTALSLGTFPGVPILTLTNIPYSSNSVFEAFLLSPRTQQSIIDVAKAQSSDSTPETMDTFSRCLSLVPGRSRLPSVSLKTQLDINRERLDSNYRPLSHRSQEGSDKGGRSSGDTSTLSGVSGQSIFWSPIIETLDGAPLLMSTHVATELASYVPSTLSIRNWILRFCTKIHGVSFQTFYRLLSGCGPCIILIYDTGGTLFGAFCSSSIRDCHHYYGTGESFVFTFNKQYSKTKLLSKSQPLPHPSLRQVHFDPQLLLTTEPVSIFPWSSQNSFFIFSNSRSIAIGGGGAYAITVDSSFLRGSSSSCITFNNPCLASSPDFLVRYFQVWCFKDPS